MRLRELWLFLVAVGLLLSGSLANAYVDLAPTLGRIVRESETITLAEVERFRADKGAVILKKVRDLKGKTGDEAIKQYLMRADEATMDRAVVDWAEPGRQCVIFTTGKTALVCLGQAWCQVQSTGDGWWRLGPSRPDLPLAYYGAMWRLSDAVECMVAGKTAVITTVPHGGEQEAASFDLALNRAALPGLVKVQRLRASLSMPPMAMAALANAALIVGQGQAGEDEIPALREKLRSDSAVIRAESAADLGSLGVKAVDAAADLERLLDAANPMVKMSAAAALLRMHAAPARAMKVLANGLASEDASVRRHAARAAGLANSAAASVADKLGVLLSDDDLLVRRTALQAIATLGPTAAGAAPQVMPLLQQPDTLIDAADALGRIGAAARPALPALAKLLDADSTAVRWAAVRAMSQIGGEEAKPAVAFMMKELRSASQVDLYNMMIYLALLGPVAREAIPDIQRARLGNPFLRQLTSWAIDPGENLPGIGIAGGMNVAQWALESYIHELGDQLRPTARALAKKIMDGTAGNVPVWGYKLLARFVDETLPILSPGLAAADTVHRERAAVALGYMGAVARQLKPQVAQAAKAAANEKERLLLEWCLREIE